MPLKAKRLKLYPYLASLIILFGFALRANFLRQSAPYIDEYYTILAARMIQQLGYPLLPSGLFYSHGFLYSYLIAGLGWLVSVTGLPPNFSQIDLIYRAPNLLISVLAMATLAAMTQRWFGRRAALMALILLAVYPHGIVWGARVRMYTLTYLLVPLLAYVFYQAGRWPKQKRWYAAALVVLLIALLSHNLLLMFVPLLLSGAVLVGWGRQRAVVKRWQWWAPGLALTVVIVAFAAYLQGLGLVVSETEAQNQGWQGMFDAILGRINPLTAVSSNGDLIRQFFWNNQFNLLTLCLVIGAGLWGLFLLGTKRRQTTAHPYFWPLVYLYWLLIGGLAEFLFVVEPGLKQPRYVTPLFILTFIIIGGWGALGWQRLAGRFRPVVIREQSWLTAAILISAVGLWFVSARQLPKIFFEGLPAVAYDRAFQFVAENAQAGDPVLSPLPAAASLYLENPTYFAAQNAIHTFVHLNTEGVLGDRWIGAPWLHTAQQFKTVLQDHPRVWLVVDQLTLESQFNSDWKQLVRHNTTNVWHQNGIFVFRGEGLIYDLPTKPDLAVDVQLDDRVKLVGYSRTLSPTEIQLTLFWQALAPLPEDYTTFVHVRNQTGDTVAQIDVQPLAGEYPTSRWKAGEIVVDQIAVPLPPDLSAGSYRLLLGLYQWDTLERLEVANDQSGESAIELEVIEAP